MADNENLNSENKVEENVTTDVASTEKTEVAAKDSGKKAKTEDKGKKKPAKEKFFKRVGASLKRFWKMMKSELKKVVWYSRKQTFTSTLLVLVVMAISAVVIGLVDLGLSKGLEFITNLF